MAKGKKKMDSRNTAKGIDKLNLAYMTNGNIKWNSKLGEYLTVSLSNYTYTKT